MALWRIRATVDDRPGYLSVLTASLALRSVNILTVQVHTTEDGAVDDFLVDAPGTLSEADLLGAVTRGRGRDVFIARAEAEGLADQPTRALALAGRLVHDPEALGEALAALLEATEVRWRPADPAGRPALAGPRMTLADPVGGSFEVLRAAPAFTPAEYARAQALVEVSGALLRQADQHVTLLLPDGAELHIRPGTGADLKAVRGLHERSSAATRQRRYLGGGQAPPDARLRRLLAPAGGLALLAEHGDDVVAMANLLVEGDVGEVALMVEDAWQRRGIGTALLRRLYAYADRAGLAAIVAHTRADNVAMLRTLRRIGTGTAARDGMMLSVTVPVVERRATTDETAAAPG
jgi:GNAT superfamily N-acetyltransferase